MDTTAEQLLKNMDELTSIFSSRMEEFEKSLQQQGSATSGITVKGLAADFTSFKTFIWKSLGILKSQVELLQLGLDRLDMHSRRKSLLFHGIEEITGEDTRKKLLEVLTKRMKLNDLGSDAIESCHRLGAKKESTRPILVRFSTAQHRSMVWKAKTILKGSKTSISEFLTKSRQDVFVAARNHFGMKKCWSADGNIVILLPNKNRRKIVSMAELKIVISEHPKNTL